MKLFLRKSKCPNCNNILAEKPKRKQKCPSCGKYIVVRSGKLLTEEEAHISDWLVRLEYFGVTYKDFKSVRNNLSNQFGYLASVNDTLWRILTC